MLKILQWVNDLCDASLRDVSDWFDIIRQHPGASYRVVDAANVELPEGVDAVLIVWEGPVDISDAELAAAFVVAWNADAGE